MRDVRRRPRPLLGGLRQLASQELLVVALMIAATIGLHQAGYRRSILLGYFLWPVVLAAYYHGVRRAFAAATASVLLVTWFAAAVPTAFTAESTPTPARWVDIAVWAVLLFLTAALVGRLHETRRRAFEELGETYAGVLELLAKFIDMADRYTEAHSARVARYARALAERLGLPPEQVSTIHTAALLHDVGKLDLDPRLLRKAGRLEPFEWRQVRRHPAAGAWIVGRVGGRLAPAIPAHHERFDGSGYYGLRGEEIPLGARVLAVADAFDAMTTTRAYRPALPVATALERLRAQRGQQLDPRIVDEFVQQARDPGSPIHRLAAETNRRERRSRPRPVLAKG